MQAGLSPTPVLLQRLPLTQTCRQKVAVCRLALGGVFHDIQEPRNRPTGQPDAAARSASGQHRDRWQTSPRR